MFGWSFQSADAPVVRRVVIQEQLIIGVPVRPQISRPIEWQEKHGPKCIPQKRIAGAILSSNNDIDFVLSDRSRIRAKLQGNCPALDFYGRFYLQPEDSNVCAGRDMVRTRMGGACQIEKFRVLKAKVRN